MAKTDSRKSEILKACRELYQKMNFKEITLKEISAYTSFSRPSIYNYFSSKESIFLEIFREEYALWCESMDEILITNNTLSKKEFADKIAQSLSKRPVLLKLLSMNMYDLEENCTLEDLINFKKEYKHALELLEKLLTTYFPNMAHQDRTHFIYTLFPFMFGLYPYTNITQKQLKAMEHVEIKAPDLSVYDFVYHTILTLLNSYLTK